jgi:hypothetical protein
MSAKIRRVSGGLRYVCAACNSVLVEKDDQILHDQYARGALGGLDESKPLSCKFAGQRFEVPTVDLKP